MSGLKQFYLKHIRIFTIILVLIAAFIIYKCWEKKSEADKMTTSSSLVVPKKKEFYDLGVASEVAYGQGRSGTGDFSNVDFGTRGIYSQDPALQAVLDDENLQIGSSGFERRTKSKQLLPTEFGVLYESDLPSAYYEGSDY